MTRPGEPSALDPEGYERPTQRWVCGRAAEGRPCHGGPDGRGRCPAGFECAPQRRGDRWHCTRSALAGGSCASGPWPDGTCRCAVDRCQPVPSLRARRGRVAFWLAAATLGLLAWGLYGPFRDSIVEPGSLSRAHAAAPGACAACHAGDRTQSALCLECHSALGPRPLAPHGEDPAHLAAVTSVRRDTGGGGEPPAVPLILAVASSGRDPAAEVACAACHVEHRGPAAALTEMDDLRCQACHSVQFAGFTRGHPEFADYPGARRPSIAFDHRSHVGHIREDPGGAAERLLSPDGAGVEALVCAACHRLDPGGAMRVPGFEAGCGSCHHHGAQIRGAARVAFLRLPGLDVASLAEAGLSAGEWPRAAEGPDNDSEPTAFMRALIDSGEDPDGSAVPLFDLYEAGPERMAAAARYAWSVKELLYDLVTRREDALADRLSGQFDVAGLSGSPLADEARAARQELWPSLEAFCRRWLPHLMDEVPAFRAGTIRVRIGPARPRRPAPSPVLAPAEKPAPQDLDSLLEEPEPPPADLDSLLEDDLLAEDPAEARPAEAPAAERAPRRGEEDEAEWDATARWSASPRDPVLSYRASGHADRFVRAWLDWSAPVQDASPAARRLFEELSHPERGAGRCTKCHGVRGTETGGMALAWTARRPIDPRVVFTHAPHLASGGATCSSCHASAERVEAELSSTSFAGIRLGLCADCHRPRGAPDGCLTCHRYHRGGGGP